MFSEIARLGVWCGRVWRICEFGTRRDSRVFALPVRGGVVVAGGGGGGFGTGGLSAAGAHTHPL